MFKLVVLALSWIISLITAQEANITVPPRAVNISINRVAEFNCTAVASNLYWESNGRQMSDGEGVVISPIKLVNLQKNIRMFTLRMTVTSTDNATNITCIAYSLSPKLSAKSGPALLLVQGLLKPVSNLTVTHINSTTVLISWCPPFTLEGIPILGYNVTCTNTTSGKNETMSMKGDTTMLYYSIDHPDSENSFTVTVVPINEDGSGKNASLIFLISVNPIVSTSQVISFTSVLPMSLNSTQDIDVPPISPSVTAIHSVLPVQFINNKSVIGIIIGVMIFLVLSAAAIGVIIVIINRKRKRDQACTVDQNSWNEDQEPVIPLAVSNLIEYTDTPVLTVKHIESDHLDHQSTSFVPQCAEVVLPSQPQESNSQPNLQENQTEGENSPNKGEDSPHQKELENSPKQEANQESFNRSKSHEPKPSDCEVQIEREYSSLPPSVLGKKVKAKVSDSNSSWLTSIKKRQSKNEPKTEEEEPLL